jgi:hypothetical protein
MNRETLKIQRLAGVISESEYSVLLEEVKQDEDFDIELKKLKDLSLEYVTKYGKCPIF